MNAEILAVGTELLMGQITNTNAQYISSRLPEAGIAVLYQSVVGDNANRLKECLSIALSRVDIVITTGGLGPTQDDLTKETISELFKKKLVLDELSLNKMQCFFEKINRPMTHNNVKQAYLPEGSYIIRNSNGTAPGCIIENEGKIIIMLPGPPVEMRPMFDDTVLPYLNLKTNSKLVSKYLRIFGMGESAVEDRLIDLIGSQTNPTIAPYAKDGEITLRITANYQNTETGPDIIEPVVNEIKNRLGGLVYSDNNMSMEQIVAEQLINSKYTIAIAESCTGGLIASKLTETPGISKSFERAIVTYSNASKIQELFVNEQTLEKFGAVSNQTATEMADGIRTISNADIGLSVTGIAGPEGGTAEKPVGLVYIALSTKEGTECQGFQLSGSRSRIRNLACLHALNLVRRYFSDMTSGGQAN